MRFDYSRMSVRVPELMAVIKKAKTNQKKIIFPSLDQVKHIKSTQLSHKSTKCTSEIASN